MPYPSLPARIPNTLNSLVSRDTECMKDQADTVIPFCSPTPKRRFTPDFLYEPIAAGWPPARQCREVTDEHRIRKAAGRVVYLNSICSRTTPAGVPDRD